MDLRDILDQVVKQGGRVEKTSKGHVIVFPADKSQAPIVTSGTPSDWRAVRNFVARLRRAGFVIKGGR